MVIGEWERGHGRKVVLIVAAACNYGDFAPVLAGRVPPGGVGRRAWAGYAAGAVVLAWLLGHVLDDRAGRAFDLRRGPRVPLLDPDPRNFGPDAWGVWSGTSFAAPQITGALARLHEEEGYPLQEALRLLLAAGQPVPGYGRALKILPGA